MEAVPGRSGNWEMSRQDPPLVKTRPYRPEDLGAIVRVFTESVHSIASTYYASDQIEAWAPRRPDLEGWARRLSGLVTIVADSEGEVVGFISFVNTGYIDLLFTSPARLRSGVATRMYLEAEGVLESRGVSKITTHASLAAQGFFARQGFSVDGEEAVEVRGAVLRRFAMSKALIVPGKEAQPRAAGDAACGSPDPRHRFDVSRPARGA